MNILDQRLAWVNQTNFYEYGTPRYTEAVSKLAASISFLYDSLNQLVLNGPVSDEDIIAPSLRDELINLKLAVRVINNSRQGYTCATYLGGRVHDVIEENKKRPVVSITISGPVQSGKTIIANEIVTMMQKKFGINIVTSNDLIVDDAGTVNYQYSQWELDMIKKNIWKIEETGPLT